MPENSNVRERIARINAIKDQCLKNKTSYFVEHSEQSVTVTNERLNASQIVSIVMTDNDGPDEAYVFSMRDTDLQVGDYLTLEDDTCFLLYESVRIIKNVDYAKFKAFECNVLVNNSIHAYFISSQTSPKDIKMSSEFETSKLLPVLICPLAAGIAINDQIKINNQVWDVVECDDLSTTGIGYYTIERGTNTMSSQSNMPKDKSNILYTGTTFSVSTEDGYYSSETTLEVIKRTATQVIFKVPDAAEFTVITQKDGKNVETTYTVKESR